MQVFPESAYLYVLLYNFVKLKIISPVQVLRIIGRTLYLLNKGIAVQVCDATAAAHRYKARYKKIIIHYFILTYFSIFSLSTPMLSIFSMPCCTSVSLAIVMVK